MPAHRSKSGKQDAGEELRRDPYEVLGVSRKSRVRTRNWLLATDMFKEVTFSYSILSDSEKRWQYDSAGFDAVESENQELELDLSSLGALNTMFAALFSKLGVPIKTTVSATVLEEALNGTVSIHQLPLGHAIFRKVEKQCAHFYSVTITEEEARAGLVCWVQSPERSKFKLLYFDQEENGGLNLSLQEDSVRTGKVTSAGLYFLGFPVYRFVQTVTSLRNAAAAIFKQLEGFQPCELTEVKAGTHVFAVYGDNFFKSASYSVQALCVAPFTEEKENLRHVLTQFTDMTSRYAQEMQAAILWVLRIDERFKRRNEIHASYTCAAPIKRSLKDGNMRDKKASTRERPKKKKWFNIQLKVDKRKRR
ncbi:hypothetical protein K2173_022055 [Erythroxylum novogranatense]|uniref:J domain-containing protein n=1 Tax=Erythroxylum novogranatense TaxID=1862640 RepID=A0AAV8T2P1_9ROSI|nr:hypothetical protein K2173_022055 [Erythroxylum novogranatense]